MGRELATAEGPPPVSPEALRKIPRHTAAKLLAWRMHESPDAAVSADHRPVPPAETPPASRAARPAAITVVCVINLLGVLFLLPFLFTVTIPKTGSWHPWYLAAGGLVSLVATAGLWRMKRWAFFTWLAYAAVDQAVLLSNRIWEPASLVIPLVFIAIIAVYYKRLV